MNINTEQIVPISEANQNFSRVARMVDRAGEVYIFKKQQAQIPSCRYRKRYHYRNDRRRKD